MIPMGADHFYIETIHKEYDGRYDPVFFNKEDFPWAADLEKSYDQIMECLAPVFADGWDGLLVNPELHMQYPLRSWKALVFHFYGFKVQKNLAQFPYLAEKLSQIPHLVHASISVLEPGAKLHLHNGNTNAFMRVHYPLKVPAPFPQCGMTIEDREVSWEGGKVFIFCDMKMHQAQNMTSQRRYILLLDVMRPEFIHLKRKVCVHINAQVLKNAIVDKLKSIFQG